MATQIIRAGPAETLVRARAWVESALIFLGVLAVYAVFAEAPRDAHHVYLAKAILNGSFDVGAAGMPTDYVDVVESAGNRYVPFPPGPALLLVPFVAVWGTAFSQTAFSVTLGAANVVLFWHVLGSVDVSPRTRILGVLFFAFGTVHFYAATTGAVWQYNHVAAVFFLLIAVLLLLNKGPLMFVAMALGLAVICRPPVLMAAPFFLYYAYRQHSESLTIAGLTDGRWLRDVAAFSLGLAPFGLLILGYNYARFDDPFDSGYHAVYTDYISGDTNYSYYRQLFPDSSHFGLFDLRNIPLHIHALLLMPPAPTGDWMLAKPSPFGMSVLLTSPAFIYALLVRRKTPLKAAAWIAIGLVSIPLFLHYSQGWIQFGYRFLLDFAPFLLILTALGMDDNQSPFSRRAQLWLVVISVVVGFWGVTWARHGF